MSKKRDFPIAVLRVLKAGKVEHVDLYAGRMIRNGQGAMKYKPSSTAKTVKLTPRPSDDKMGELKPSAPSPSDDEA
jgi:hypothetical protein